MVSWLKRILFSEDQKYKDTIEKYFDVMEQNDNDLKDSISDIENRKYIFNERFTVESNEYYVTNEDHAYRVFKVNSTIELILWVGVAEFWEHEGKIPRQKVKKSIPPTGGCAIKNVKVYLQIKP